MSYTNAPTVLVDVDSGEDMIGDVKGGHGESDEHKRDDFHASDGNGEDGMHIDLPQDSALSAVDEARQHSFNGALNQLHIDACSICNEEAFNVDTKEGICLSCRRISILTDFFSVLAITCTSLYQQ